MKDRCLLDAADISDLGIGFGTDEEMGEFAAVISAELATRVNEAMKGDLSPEQFRVLASITKDSRPEEAELQKLNWLQIRESCRRIRDELKSELLKYREQIPGLCPSPLTQWYGRPIEECGELTLRELKLLKKAHVETLGELYHLDEETFYDMLEMPGYLGKRHEQLHSALDMELYQEELVSILVDT